MEASIYKRSLVFKQVKLSQIEIILLYNTNPITSLIALIPFRQWIPDRIVTIYFQGLLFFSSLEENRYH